MPIRKHTLFNDLGNTTQIKLSTSPIMKNHDGYDCKTYAIAGALDWFYKNNLTTQPPLPARKRDYENHQGESLRQLAKSKFESAVGEIHNIDALVKLANHHPEINAQYYQANALEDFVDHLAEALNNNQIPIIFYDIDTNWDSQATPISQSGETEHAVIVVGYEKNNEGQITKLMISTWGDIYTVDAKTLFDSSAQLPTTRIHAEEYKKIYTHKAGLGAWLPNEYFKKGYQNTIYATRLETSKTSNNGMGKKILLIGLKNEMRVKETPHPF